MQLEGFKSFTFLIVLLWLLSTVLRGLAGIQEKCWERNEISSGNYHKDHLTDGNKLTYWESSGPSGSHWIRQCIICKINCYL